MTPEEKLKKAIRLAEGERNMPIDSKPITFQFTLEEPELKKPPLGVKPFWL